MWGPLSATAPERRGAWPDFFGKHPRNIYFHKKNPVDVEEWTFSPILGVGPTCQRRVKIISKVRPPGLEPIPDK